MNKMTLVNPTLLNSSFIPHLTFSKPLKPVAPILLQRRIIFPRYNATTANVNDSERKSANYQPNLWTYDFLQSLKHAYADIRYEDRAKMLKEEVRRMIKDESSDIWLKLELINDVKRLGLSYHYDKEIHEVLLRCHSSAGFSATFVNTSLHETALCFRLLREYGHDVSPDIFERFKEENGNFKENLVSDVKGMLSLYEASFLGYEGEKILDEAMVFSSFHLRVALNKGKSSNMLLEQVNHALELPLHHRIQRLEARWYIESYAKRTDSNQLLLEAAKLDFNIVQSTLQNDLQQMSRWWRGMGLASKLSFSRDRLMECFFWTVGMVFEPQFSDLRKGLTKVTSLITTIDDVYDVYGTLDELELFTAAVESWDVKAVQVLPDYMKICFLALYNTVNEFAYDALKEHGQDILPYLTKAWSDMLKAFLQEAKWSRDRHLPKFEDYLNNAWVSVSGVAELERGEAASSIVCYIRESGASEEGAYKHIHSLLNETWKKMNKDRVSESPFPKAFVETAMNLGRISQCTYQYGDGHGAPDSTAKSRIRSLIIEPIALYETEAF
ncbi:hypothetical protein V8G54_023445 [Vigna mungo]|uniref:Uncharacterized protein n=1 Tax=Vigna mungo TaxID=3915 RepID=A0AAQ3N472_VIGMU